jgi:hypothetical protein
MMTKNLIATVGVAQSPCLIFAERAKHGAVRSVRVRTVVLVVAASRLSELRGDAHTGDQDWRGGLGLDRQLRRSQGPKCADGGNHKARAEKSRRLMRQIFMCFMQSL